MKGVCIALIAVLLIESSQQTNDEEKGPSCWTPWFDRDDPSATGDWETLIDLHKESPGRICDNPLDIQVETIAGANMTSTGDRIFKADTTTGFVCKNEDQKCGKCEDYRVRFQCPKSFCDKAPICWTQWFDRDDPSEKGDWETLEELRKENPGKICDNPIHIHVQTIDGGHMSLTNDIIDIADTTTGFICKNEDQTNGSCTDYRVQFMCPQSFCEPGPKCWTEWFDRDDPSATGDWETLSDLRTENPGKICNNPLNILVQTTAGDTMVSTGDKIHIADTTTGFVCKNEDQDGTNCQDYRVQFQCPESFCRASPKCWTQWFDRDDPSVTGDWETLSDLRKENPGKICDNPLDINVQTIAGDTMASTGDTINIADTTTGFVCKNEDQDGDRKCEDYRVQFQCPENLCKPGPKCWTPWFDRDNPSGKGDWETLTELHKENPGQICDNPLDIQVQTTAGNTMASTGDTIHKADTTTGFICKNKDQDGTNCQDYRVRFQCPKKFCDKAPICWTQWFDRDNPSGKGDWETLEELRQENPGKICDNPIHIHVQTIDGGHMSLTNNIIHAADTTTGFVCKNEDQKTGNCEDYRVQFMCPHSFCEPGPKCWTEWFDRDNPSGKGDWETLEDLRTENPGKICDNPLNILVQTTAGDTMVSTGDNIHIADTTTGFVCRNEDQDGTNCKDYRVQFQCPESFCKASPKCWTQWFDRDDPSATGDWETLSDLRTENPGKICDNPLNINVQTIAGDIMASTGDTINIADTTTGFVCKNEDQDGDRKCEDYRVQFQCPEKFCKPGPQCWTPWFDRDNPSGTGDWETLSDLRKENPGKICDNPLDIEVQTTAGDDMDSTGDTIRTADTTTGFVCKNKEQDGGVCKDYRVKFQCPKSFCEPGPKCWTQWFDRDDPSATGDWETLSDLRTENPGKICDNPLNINVQTIAGDTMASTGDTINIADTTTGFVCKNEDQDGDRKCEDYRVQFQCPERFCKPGPTCWTPWFDRDNPSGKGDWETLTELHKENPGQICDNPFDIQVQTTAGDTMVSTGDTIHKADTTTGFICKNKDQDGTNCQDYRVRFQCPKKFCDKAPICWTQWFDRDNPSGKGDWETLEELRQENPGKICDNPIHIHVQTIDGGHMSSTNNIIDTADTTTGFVCKNEDQKTGNCEDYRVQFMCPQSFCEPGPKCWTEWFDRDNPSGKGDWETLEDLRQENPGKICNNPLNILVQTTAGDTMVSTGDNIHIADTSTGLVCRNEDQDGTNCKDYRVQFQCPESFCKASPKCWTQWFDRDDPSATGDWETLSDLRTENPGKICDNPLNINVQTIAGDTMASTGDTINIADTTTGFVCKNEDQDGDRKCEDYRVQFQCPKRFCKPGPTCWTPWFDRDNPSGKGDWETLTELHKENPGQICDNPLDIQVQTTAGDTMVSTGDTIHKADTTTGFICKNKDQDGTNCQDYRVRFQCPKKFCDKAPICWTQWFDRDNPSGKGDWETLKELRKENPGKICDNPIHIHVQTIDGGHMSSTNNIIHTADTTTGFVCKNKDQQTGNCEDYRVQFMCPQSFCEPGPKCWTQWFDRDNPSGTGDWETLSDLRTENPGKICDNPLNINVQTIAGDTMASTGDTINIADTTTGFVCKNQDQDGGVCKDYRVKFQCPKSFCEPGPNCWTPWFDRDNPSGTGDWETLSDLRKENPGQICDNPLDIEVQTTAGDDMDSTGDTIYKADASTGFVCKNKEQDGGTCKDYRVRFQCPKKFCEPDPKCWTTWFDRDNPSGTGDWETLKELWQEYPGKICNSPLDIEVQTLSGNNMGSTGDTIARADTSMGFVCKNSDQTDGKCEDYHVRFQCPKVFCDKGPKCWTPWFDRDNPSGTGDWETLSDLRQENPGQICDNPFDIEVQTTAGDDMASTGDTIYKADETTGFICKIKDQEDGKCEDYRVRFKCPSSFCPEVPRCWTPWLDRDNPSGTGDWETLKDLRIENPGKICDAPLQIDVQTKFGGSIESTGDVITVADTETGFICENAGQKCGKCKDYRVRFQCSGNFCTQRVCWTKWYDRDNPSGDGDYENLAYLRKAYPKEICKEPLYIEVVTTDTNKPFSATGQISSVLSPTEGFACRNAQQKGGMCLDYKVRFGCACNCDGVMQNTD